MELLVHAYTVKAARREMKKSGGRRFGDKDYCDKCIGENKL